MGLYVLQAENSLSSDDVDDNVGPTISEHDIALELETFRQQWYSEIQSQLKSSRNLDDKCNRNVVARAEEPTQEDKVQLYFKCDC
jgi:hypothetical protein